MVFEFLKCIQGLSIKINLFLPVNAHISWLLAALFWQYSYPLIKGRVDFNNDK
jgi:hypothetical protein